MPGRDARFAVGAEVIPGDAVAVGGGADPPAEVALAVATGHDVTSSSGQTSRFTDQQTMDDLLMVYAGRTNKRLVEGLQARGVNAVGICGLDGGMKDPDARGAFRWFELEQGGRQAARRSSWTGIIPR